MAELSLDPVDLGTLGGSSAGPVATRCHVAVEVQLVGCGDEAYPAYHLRVREVGDRGDEEVACAVSVDRRGRVRGDGGAVQADRVLRQRGHFVLQGRLPAPCCRRFGTTASVWIDNQPKLWGRSSVELNPLLRPMATCPPIMATQVRTRSSGVCKGCRPAEDRSCDLLRLPGELLLVIPYCWPDVDRHGARPLVLGLVIHARQPATVAGAGLRPQTQ